MFSSTPRNGSSSDEAPFPVGYKSMILKEFVNTLASLKDAQTLDVGPVCQENMMFFAQQLGKHYVCDMFLRLKEEKPKELPQNDGWKHLDYPKRNFDGIQLWDLCDRLGDDDVGRLVELCYTMLRETGLLMLISFEKKPTSPNVNTFVIDQNWQVNMRPQPHLAMPWKFRHNRALTSLMSNFTIIRSFRYHSGVREFLFKKPGGYRD